MDRNIVGHSTLLSVALSPAHTRAWIETLRSGRLDATSSSRPLTRGRGSKHVHPLTQPALQARRPLTRGRGSKLDRQLRRSGLQGVARSHAGVDRNRQLSNHYHDLGGRPLTRGRGSKPRHRWHIFDCRPVARSHAGVDRNPHATTELFPHASRPLTRGRGSKHRHLGPCKTRRLSPAHTRAWIETILPGMEPIEEGRRPLTRGRGSKLPLGDAVGVVKEVARSHAGVDRNIQGKAMSFGSWGSPAHTRAWIETCRAQRARSRFTVARSHAGVDRNMRNVNVTEVGLVARSHAGVDRNSPGSDVVFQIDRRPLTRGRGSKRVDRHRVAGSGEVARSHAGVDRNFKPCVMRQRRAVARSHAGVDRNRPGLSVAISRSGRPLTRGRGSKLLQGD